MGIFNWFSNNKAQSINEGKITAKQVLDFSKTYEELKPYFALFVHFFKSVLNSEKEIEQEVKEIQSKKHRNERSERERELKKVQDLLNGRPRKAIGFQKPIEVFN